MNENKYVRKGVNFNVDNPHQRVLYDWVTRQSKRNFSGYVKNVLFAQMERTLEKERSSSDSSTDDKSDDKRHK